MRKPETKYAVLLTSLYFIASVVGVLHHELWLDEAHHWLLARDSGSVAELVVNTKLEGHPLVWSFLLYAITRFTVDPVGMQLLHIAIATFAIYVLVRNAPFSWLFKAVFVFGYFMIYEYDLISRNYILGLLFLFLACSLFDDREKKFPLICFYLALVSNIHIMFSIPAFALFLTLLLEPLLNRFASSKILPGCAIFGLGIGAVLMQFSYTESSWLLDPINEMPFIDRIGKGYISLFKGLFPIPDFRTHYFWNSNLIVNLSKPFAGVLAFFAYFLPLLLFFRNRKILFFVYAALAGMQIFFFITQRDSMRFYGMTYIIIVMALWIEHYYTAENYAFKNWLTRRKLTSFKRPFVWSLLAIHLCVGVYAWTTDYIYPFTSAKKTVEFLKAKKLDSREIVTVTCDGTIISAYLGRKIWFLCEGNYHSYCQWNIGCAGKITPENISSLVTDYLETHSDAIFVSFYPLSSGFPKHNRWTSLNDKVEFRFLKSKSDFYVADNGYLYVYEIRKKLPL